MAKKIVLAVINKDEDSFGIHFPDYPGAVSAASSLDEAITRGRATLEFHLAGLAEDGDPIADPDSSAKSIHAALLADQDCIPVAIEVEFPGRAVRVNITIEESLLSLVDTAASSGGQSRSAFLADAARARLRQANR